MADFLESYATMSTGREKFVKIFFLAVLLVLLGAAGDWILAKLGKPNLSDIREQWQAWRFFSLLEKKDYQSAYRLWGCDPAKPCRDYSMDKFLEDWGPKGPYADPARRKTEITRHCSSGIIQTVTFGSGEPLHLYVNSGDLRISFSPWPVCNPRIPSP